MKRVRLSTILSLAVACLSNTSTPSHASEGLLKTLGLTFLSLCSASRSYVNKYMTHVTEPNAATNYDLGIISNDKIMATGKYGDYSSFISEMDGYGEELNTKYFQNMTFVKVVPKYNGEFYIIGKHPHTGTYSKVSSLVILKGTTNDNTEALKVVWAKQVLFSMSMKINDASEGPQGGIVVVGDGYGLLTDDTTFTLLPRGFVLNIDSLGASFQGGAFGLESGTSHSAVSVVHEGGGTLSVIGWTTDGPQTNVQGLPSMLISILNDLSTPPRILRSYQLTLLEEGWGTGIFDASNPENSGRGIIPVKHIKTSKGFYYVTGVATSLIDNDTLSSLAKNELFAAEINPSNGQALWIIFFSNNNFNYSVGLGIAEAANGDCLISGGYMHKNGTKGILYIRASEDYGILYYAKKFVEEGYELAGGFSMNLTGDGKSLLPGVINKEGANVNISMLLIKLTDGVTEDCGETIEGNFTGRDRAVDQIVLATANEQLDTLYEIDNYFSFLSSFISVDNNNICTFIVYNEEKKSPIAIWAVSLITMGGFVLVVLGLIHAYAHKNKTCGCFQTPIKVCFRNLYRFKCSMFKCIFCCRFSKYCIPGGGCKGCCQKLMEG